MDVESLRSGRSEKSDRSRKSRRLHQSFGPPSNGGVPEEQIKLLNTPTMINPEQATRHPDFNLTSPTPFVSPTQLIAGQPQQTLPRSQAAPYTMHSWAHSPQLGSNFVTYPQPTPFPPVNWQNSSQPGIYPQQPFNNLPVMPISNQGHQPMQGLIGQPQFGFPTSDIHHMNQPVLNHQQASKMNNTPTPSQTNEVYRTESYEPRPRQDENAWVEEATAVTGATSETGLSGGDNLSRFGARYGLAASLGMPPGVPGNGVISGAAAALIRAESDKIPIFTCSQLVGILTSSLLALAALLSPILMLLLPHLPVGVGWMTDSCNSTCEGNLVGISVKLILLALATWAISSLCRPLCAGGSAILPRVRLCRTLFLCSVFVVLFAFWLFYTVRVVQPKEGEYLNIILFANSLTDTLLFMHFAAIGLMELRKERHRYAIHIVRSPDGISRTYKCGDMSLQRAAFEVLQFYMVEFTAFIPGPVNNAVGGGKRSRRTGPSTTDPGSGSNVGSKYKVYDVDGAVLDNKSGNGATSSGGGYRMGSQLSHPNNGDAPVLSASARLYEELEVEKRTRKRRMRLLLAVEEAFTHVRRLATENNAPGHAAFSVPNQNNSIILKSKFGGPDKSLDPYEAAQAVFPTLIRPLQKYMRVTRQQARHPVDMVIDHLAMCLAYGLSPLAFLERFNPTFATPQNDCAAAATAILNAKRDCKEHQRKQDSPTDCNRIDTLLPKRIQSGGQQSWSIVADRALSRSLTDGVIFQLRRGSEISLLCTVRCLPLIQLVEDALEPFEVGRFALSPANAV